MTKPGIFIGIGAGLLIGLGLLAWLTPGDRSPAKPLPEDVGRISRVVIHYAPGIDLGLPGTGEVVADIYRQFLRAAGPGFQIIWVVENQRDLDDLKTGLGDVYPSDSLVLLTHTPITTWAKDRFTCLVSEDGRGPTLLLAPARKAVSNPLRINDQEVPWRLTASFPRLFACRDLQMDFDGGDVLATSRGLLVHPAILSRNVPLPQSFPSAEDLRSHLRSQLGELVWLGPRESDVPPHHVGMFLTLANGTAFVGDVRLAETLLARHAPELETACQSAGGLADAPTRTELVRQLDHVADQMRSLGLPVVRVPLVPSATPRAWMSYNNGIVETRAGRTFYYMPSFALKPVDDAAADAFRAAGCQVLPIDCSRIWHLCGSLHCLVNVVERH